MAATPEQLHTRELIWEKVRATIDAWPDDPIKLDAQALAMRLIAEHPGSGLSARQVAVEFHRIRRAMRPGGRR